MKMNEWVNKYRRIESERSSSSWIYDRPFRGCTKRAPFRQQYNTYRKRMETKVREKEGRYNVLVCLRVITGVNNTRGARERGPPTWIQVGSFRNSTKSRRSSRLFLRSVTLLVPLIKMTKHFLSSCPGPRTCTFSGSRKLNNPRHTLTRSPGNIPNDRARVYYVVYINV